MGRIMNVNVELRRNFLDMNSGSGVVVVVNVNTTILYLVLIILAFNVYLIVTWECVMKPLTILPNPTRPNNLTVRNPQYHPQPENMNPPI